MCVGYMSYISYVNYVSLFRNCLKSLEITRICFKYIFCLQKFFKHFCKYIGMENYNDKQYAKEPAFQSKD